MHDVFKGFPARQWDCLFKLSSKDTSRMRKQVNVRGSLTTVGAMFLRFVSTLESCRC